MSLNAVKMRKKMTMTKLAAMLKMMLGMGKSRKNLVSEGITLLEECSFSPVEECIFVKTTF